jgi:hypothetical protein
VDRAALDKRWSEIAKLRTEFDNTIQQFRLRYNGGQIEKSSSFVKPISNSNLLYNVPEQENHNPDVVNWNNFMLKSPFNFEK